jgi:cytochrome c peroxidase
MKPMYKAGIVAALFALALGAVVGPKYLTPTTTPLYPPLAGAGTFGATDAVAPLPPAPELPAAKVALGERLFRDPRLSRDDSIACASCHDLQRGGTDRSKVSAGVGGKLGGINAPTVFNSGFGFVQFWDGRAATLEEQAAGPVHNPLEMDSNWQQVLPKLHADGDYPDAFARLYPDGITAANIADAIATFERSLVTPDARFDRYLRGERAALSPREIEGYRLFRKLGCTSCHQGALLGGNMYQKFGVMRDYFADRVPTPADLGRYNVTQRAEDRHVFKVPSLRNVALTAPYFHDASAATLEQAVVVMARHQLGREIEPHDVAAIVAFLRTLTGQWQGKPLE